MSSKFIIIRVLLFVLLVVGTTSAMIAQDNDFVRLTVGEFLSEVITVPFRF